MGAREAPCQLTHGPGWSHTPYAGMWRITSQFHRWPGTHTLGASSLGCAPARQSAGCLRAPVGLASMPWPALRLMCARFNPSRPHFLAALANIVPVLARVMMWRPSARVRSHCCRRHINQSSIHWLFTSPLLQGLVGTLPAWLGSWGARQGAPAGLGSAVRVGSLLSLSKAHPQIICECCQLLLTAAGRRSRPQVSGGHSLLSPTAVGGRGGPTSRFVLF